jgi:hypothetical protein
MLGMPPAFDLRWRCRFLGLESVEIDASASVTLVFDATATPLFGDSVAPPFDASTTSWFSGSAANSAFLPAY